MRQIALSTRPADNCENCEAYKETDRTIREAIFAEHENAAPCEKSLCKNPNVARMSAEMNFLIGVMFIDINT